ncbi:MULTISPECIES: Asp23/Gls24 family envelope stress response protein [unclassified Gordonia (in: high G+C Gram-positive bacteria)]|uniref:Asp23/Gls24 family envelope stress response protein n=1 Tax=Gordonia TaxID=2053 RepID=UPI001CF9A41A|nr:MULTISPECIES: Asp23/Gls24 family envelope stress response protein [unclassified Gordonia (in: high G+C Gram-positive bacteria)]MCT1353852.1 Asp23/Gls24 family envelope stress response protein [Gordonia sp. p3-SID1431]MCZ4534883.1 Asp23/Gls24 family envelope stress response protein [Gordonia terrae]UCZ91280.1 Asp23/Gls24 family envelope stress response protein [Gordonia sp. WA4-43]
MAEHESGGPARDAHPTAGDSPPGTLTVADRVIEKIAARAALDIPGVVRHRGGVGSVLGVVGERSFPDAAVHAGGARITLSLALEWPCAVAEVSRSTRDHVAAEVERLAGIVPLRVDVTVSKFEPRQAIRRLQKGYVDLPPVVDEPEYDDVDDHVHDNDPRPEDPDNTDALTPTISIDTGVRR